MNKVEYSNAPHDGNAHEEPRNKWPAMLHGARQKCPNCGKGAVFTSYLKVADTCNNCDEELHHERSDDAAPYFTIFVLGHIIVPLLLILETHIFPPLWVYLVFGIPLIITLALLTLPRVKGAVIGLQWALRMHGFGPEEPTNAASGMDPELIGR